jgi:hypothetical protein
MTMPVMVVNRIEGYGQTIRERAGIQKQRGLNPNKKDKIQRQTDVLREYFGAVANSIWHVHWRQLQGKLN